MAKCVGCGLKVNNGILEVAVKTDGGIVCDPVTKELRIQFPANQGGGSSLLPIGCGLRTDGTGRIFVDACDKGGIICGDTADDAEDQCIYVNVQNQGNAVCKNIGDVQGYGSYPSPLNGGAGGSNANFAPGGNCVVNGCNGLVRTCDGLWAPPKLPECSGILSEQAVADRMAELLHDKTSMDSELPGSHGGAGEWAVAESPNTIIMEWCCCLPNYGAGCVRMSGNTFTNGTTPIVLVNQGQVHRFTVWERLAYVGADCGNLDALNASGWVLQNQILFDEFGPGKSSGYSSAFIDSSWIVMDLPGQCAAGQMMITYQRFGPGPTAGGRPNDDLSGAFALKREYLHTLHGSHCTTVGFQDMRGPG